MNDLYVRAYCGLAAAWRRRYLLVLPVVILPLAALLMGLLTSKHYNAHTSMLIQETAKLNPFLEDLAVSAMLKERISALKTLLHSRHILSAVATEQGLLNDNMPAQQQEQVIAVLSQALTINMLGKDLIRIDYRATEPNHMAAMLTSVSRHFIEQVLAPERSSMTSSSQFLLQHLQQRQQELDQAEQAMADFVEQHAQELPEMHLTNLNRLSQLKQLLSQREAEMASAQRRIGGINQQLSKTNPVLSLLETDIIQLQGDLAQLRGRYTDQHSAVITAQKKLRQLESERQSLLHRQGDNLSLDKLWTLGSEFSVGQPQQPLLVSQLSNLQQTHSDFEGLKEEILSLKQSITQLEKQVANYGTNASALSKLQRTLTIKRQLYDDILLRYEKANITASLGVFERDKRVKIIDRPYTPSQPTNPSLLVYGLAGLMGGLLLGCGLAIITELADNSLRKVEDLEVITGAPVLARIPYMPSLTSQPFSPQVKGGQS
ncbi:GumC family protein [Motilimonas pumila]|uniref:Chain-length determining protein n=1 Tax=Motilimonas pumila TaxID=2303987 RepID=A0A418YD77_9GAMM|nr:chain-length determining protein [Motilimonas pumila]RJG42466.1 chain-length determining protein [Motilimonas pumila]